MDTRSYWQERLGSRFDLSGVGHSGYSLRYNRWLYRVKRRVFWRVLRSLPLDLRSADVLDLGSGVGFFVDAWRAVEPHSITASDFADVCVAGLRRQFPDVTVRQLDVTGDLSALDGARFTLISAFDVLLHVVDDTQWQRALGNVYQMLQPGGLFLFSDNFVQGEPLRSAHVVHRSLAQQEAALREAGLEVVARVPLFVLMHDPLDRPPGWLRLWTRVVRRVDRLSAPIGSCLGALQYPVEILLTRLCRETPSVELMVCRRPS